MKKFKIFMASMMAYLMIVMILPVSSLELIANAAEKESQYLERSDLYLRSVSQYKDKSLVSYGKEINGKNVTIISLFNNGQEKIVKEIDGYWNVNFNSNINGKIKINIGSYENETKLVMEYDFNTGNINEIDGTKYSESLMFYTVLNPDKNITESIIKKIESKYKVDYSKEYENGKASMQISKANDVSGIINFYFNVNTANGSQKYMGTYNNNFECISSEKIYTDIDQLNNIITIQEPIDNKNKYKIIRIKDGQIISEGLIELSEDSEKRVIDTIIGNKLYTGIYKDNVIEYLFEDGIYKKINTYNKEECKVHSSAIDSRGELWLLTEDDDKVFISMLENSKIVKKYEVPAYIYMPSDGGEYYEQMQLYIYDDSNIIVSSMRGTVFINNAATENPKPEIPAVPEVPVAPVLPVVPEVPAVVPQVPVIADNNGENIVIKPTENGMTKIETKTLSPNTTNVINANVDKDAKEVEVILGDIEAIKNGNGSVNVKLNDNVDINIPFSLIDKNLLDGAKAVRVKFSAIENSDIVKGIKAVNKVFNFELLVDKEDGTVSVHNFASGFAEIKLTLTDEELKGLDREKISVFYYNEETKTFEVMETVVDGNNITFKTSHFSSYIVGEKVEGTNSLSTIEGLPSTGALIGTTTIILCSLALVFVGAAMLFKNKKQKC